MCTRADLELWRCSSAHLKHWRRRAEAQEVWKSGGGAHQEFGPCKCSIIVYVLICSSKVLI